MSAVLPEDLPSLPSREARAILLTRSGRRFRSASYRALVERIEVEKRRDAARSLALADLGLARAEEIGDTVAAARFVRSRGHALRALNRYEEALRAYDAALAGYRKLRLTREAAITQIGRIDALMYLGRYEESLSSARTARRTFLAERDLVRVARLDTNTGNLFHRRDRPADALRYYDRARRIFSRLRDGAALGLVDLNRGNALSTLGKLAEARRAYSSARVELDRASMPTLVAQTDYSLAYLDYLDCRLPEALEQLDRLGPELERLGERRLRALCLLDASEIYLRLNFWREAREEADGSRETFESLGMRYEAAKSLAFSASAQLHAGRISAASAEWARALRLFEQEGNAAWCGQVCLHLARLSLLGGRLAEAERRARKALNFLTGPGHAEPHGFAELVLAAVALARGRIQISGAAVRRALRDADRSRSPWLRYEAQFAFGRAAELRGDISGARRRYGAAAREGEKLRALLSRDDFRAAFHRDKGQPYLALAALELDRGRPTQAFAHVERGRARALLDLVSQVSTARRGERLGRTRKALARAEELLRKIGSRYQQRRVAEDEGRRNPAAGEADTRATARFEAEAARLLGGLMSGARPVLAPLPSGDLKALQAALRPSETIFEYFVLRGQVGAFVVTPRKLTAHRGLMKESELNSIAESLRFQWGRFHIGSSYLEPHREQILRETNEDLAHLRRRLWDRLAADAPHASSVLVVPAGPLQSLPWAALGGQDPVVASWAVSQAPSAEIFLRCRSARDGIRPEARDERSGRTVIFAVGDPGIPEVAREAAAIARLLPRASVFSGAGATVEAYRKSAPAAARLHLAAHGVFRRDRPLFSGVRLADRWMSVYDVRATPLKARLVTLSACGTGRSEIWAGEEWMGLVRAFLSAGAARVLGALWEVDDASTRRLMELFYFNWVSGVSPAEALRKAQLDLARRTHHPYRWAGFCLVGDL